MYGRIAYALTTPSGLNVCKNMTRQSGTTPSGANVFTAFFFYKYATPLGSSCNNRDNWKHSGIAYPVGADFTSALTTPTGLNVYKNMTQQSGTTPTGSNIPATFFYKYMTPLRSCNNHDNWNHNGIACPVGADFTSALTTPLGSCKCPKD